MKNEEHMIPHNRYTANKYFIITNYFFSFFRQSTEVYSLFMLIVLICSTVFLSCSVFQFDLVTSKIQMLFFLFQMFIYRFIIIILVQALRVEFNMFTLGLITIAIMVSGINLFVYSYFGHGANETHMEISDCFFQSEWFYLPCYLQKYFVLIIANAQRPLFYDGFGVAFLNLNTFIRVTK